jgi:hypothetical protein
VKDRYYYKDGSILNYRDYDKELHRIDGPAIEWSNGYKAWLIDDKRHRIDGPAIEWADGHKSWFVDNKLLAEEEFNSHIKVQHYRFQQLLEKVLKQ